MGLASAPAPNVPARAPSEQRLRSIPWRALTPMAPALDQPIADVLRGESAERVVDRTLRRLRPPDRDARAAIAEAIFGVAVWRLRLAFHVGRDGAPPRLLLASLLRDLGGIADAETVTGLEPGSLPAPRAPPDDLGLRYSFPPWLAATLRAEAGDDAEQLADALDRPGPVCLRPNALRISSHELQRALLDEGVTTRRGHVVDSALVVTSPRPNVYGLRALGEGCFEVQDEGSQLIGALVGARPGNSVLDLCAGAGGKTLQAAAAVGTSGAVHASDPDAERLQRLLRRASRAGATAIVRVHGASPPAGLNVDRVLVDAPCSELGALRRGPDARFRMDPRAIDRFPPLQLELLSRAAGHVAPGGRLVYATCTIRREENEEVALAFEQAVPGFRRVVPALQGLSTADGFIRTWPHRHGCDGFFVALWERPGHALAACGSVPRPR